MVHGRTSVSGPVAATVSPARSAIGVLAPSAWDAPRMKRLLRTAGLPMVWLEGYDEDQVDAVKVGTTTRAKGREFKQMYLASVKSDSLKAGPAPEDGAGSERWKLERRELFEGLARLPVGVLQIIYPRPRWRRGLKIMYRWSSRNGGRQLQLRDLQRAPGQHDAS